MRPQRNLATELWTCTRQQVSKRALEHLSNARTCEPSVVFVEDLPPRTHRYHRTVKRPINLPEISRRLRSGRYDEDAGRADGMWADLQLMVDNAKLFNEPTRMEWLGRSRARTCIHGSAIGAY